MGAFLDLRFLVNSAFTTGNPMLGEHLNPSNDPLPMAPIPDAAGPANFFVGNPGDEPSSDPTKTDKRGEQAERIVTNLLVRIRPSSCSQRFTENISGYCKNVSESGCGVTADYAPRVGDIYQFEIDDPIHILHGVHARCVRCHLLDESAFDCGFSFLTPLTQAEAAIPRLVLSHSYKAGSQQRDDQRHDESGLSGNFPQRYGQPGFPNSSGC